MTNHEIFSYKTLLSTILYLFWGCCFADGGSTCLVYDYLSFIVQTLKITNRIVRGQSTLKYFFVYTVIMLSIVYAIVLCAYFYVKLLMSSAKAVVNSFDDCNVFAKAAQLSVNIYDNKLKIAMMKHCQ